MRLLLFLLDKHLGTERLYHRASMYLTFWETAKWFSKAISHSCQSMRVPVSPPALGVASLLNFSLYINCVAASHRGFSWHFPKTSWCWVSFYCLPVYLLRWSVCSNLLPFFLSFLVAQSLSVPHIFWIQVLCQLCGLKTFSPNLWFVFSFS